ncbi:hypothetical protein LTR17_019487 [Elasticomyces elasticus]|nr:hypothetical protein LTR17_019487 [Elasticomyces elasticus]
MGAQPTQILETMQPLRALRPLPPSVRDEVTALMANVGHMHKEAHSLSWDLMRVPTQTVDFKTYMAKLRYDGESDGLILESVRQSIAFDSDHGYTRNLAQSGHELPTK